LGVCDPELREEKIKKWQGQCCDGGEGKEAFFSDLIWNKRPGSRRERAERGEERKCTRNLSRLKSKGGEQGKANERIGKKVGHSNLVPEAWESARSRKRKRGFAVGKVSAGRR